MDRLIPFLASLSGLTSLALAQDTVAVTRPPLPLFTSTLTAYGEYWSNLHGGAETGSRWNTLVDFGVTLDLEHLGAPKDSALVGQVFWVKNQRAETNLPALTGSFNSPSGIQGSDQLRVFNLHYRQTWRAETRVLKIGQLSADDDFMCSAYSGLFSNGGLCTLPSQIATPLAATAHHTVAYPMYTVAGPGVFFSSQITPSFSWQIGLYHGGPGPDEKRNHGFDWESSSVAGTVTFIETTWEGQLAGRDSTFHLGGIYHTGTFDDFNALNNGQPDATQRGLVSFYASQDLVLIRLNEKRPTLAAFWHFGVSPQHARSVSTVSADAGLNWFGPFPARPADNAGLAVVWTKFGHAYRTFVGSDILAHTETALELTYRAQLSDHWAVQADLQLLDNPSDASATGSHRTATVVGLRTELSF